jgi:acid phosphatase
MPKTVHGHQQVRVNWAHRALARLLLVVVCVLLTRCASAPVQESRRRLDTIEHIVVIYAENRSFDNLYGLFPSANGIAKAPPEQYTQVDHDGKPFQVLPPVWKGKERDPTFPADLPNKPFQIDGPPINLPASVPTRDLVHRYYQNIEQINGGRNNRFAAISDAGGLVMGYYDGSKLPLWKWAQEYVLADNFFMAAFGGSYLNHLWLVCACTPQDQTAPEPLRAQVDERGQLKRRPESPASAMQGPLQVLDGALTPDGYSVNTQQPPYQPSGAPPAPGGDRRFADLARHPLPPQMTKTIGDTLSAKGIAWVWYAGAWSQALADGMQPPDVKRSVIYTAKPGTINFQPHHQPFNYFARFAPGTPDRDRHLQDGEDFLRAIDAGTLPQVAFYKPTGDLNEHPGYTDVLSGDQHIADVLARIRRSPLWPKVVVIVTYDENGGFWDHVPPPKGDRWGPGTRIPALIISPYAKRGYVDHTQYDTTSIIKFITRRFALEQLPGVREGAGDLLNAFDFAR